jgi:hypothetical protein
MRWLFVGWSVANTLWVFYALRLPSMSYGQDWCMSIC